MDFLEHIQSRGLLAQMTHPEELKEHLQSRRSAYIGFDPSAESLHVGHLMQIMALVRWQKSGHRPIVLVGGGTAQVGDPTGKTDMRKMLTPEQLDSNIASISQQLRLYLNLSNEEEGLFLNNRDWLEGLNYMQFLREFGPHFSVNKMITADCNRSRLEGKGLSFLEFNYMLLQSYDFYYLYKNHDCTVELGGDDQWSNMLGGVELIRRLSRDKAFCITSPLLTTSEGKKMGKTEKGAVWLNPNLTSPYDFYQYWRNAADKDVEQSLRFMTFLPLDQVQELSQLKGAQINQAKEVLAFEVTKFVHGEEEAKKSQQMAKSLFTNSSSQQKAPVLEIKASEFSDQALDVLSFLSISGVTSSKGEARRLVQQNGLSINEEKITDPAFRISIEQLQKTDPFMVKKGKKKFFSIKLIE